MSAGGHDEGCADSRAHTHKESLAEFSLGQKLVALVLQLHGVLQWGHRLCQRHRPRSRGKGFQEA